MNKHTIIVIAASAVIAAPFVYSVWNIVFLQDLEIRSSEHGRFSFFEISNGRAVELCNTAPFFVSFDRLDITVFYQGDDKGTYAIHSATLPPSSLSVLEGTFRSESYAESQYTFLHMDAQFGSTAPIRLDPNQMSVDVSIQTSVLGLIPYTITNQYSAYGFYSIMNEDGESFSC